MFRATAEMRHHSRGRLEQGVSERGEEHHCKETMRALVTVIALVGSVAGATAYLRSAKVPLNEDEAQSRSFSPYTNLTLEGLQGLGGEAIDKIRSDVAQGFAEIREERLGERALEQLFETIRNFMTATIAVYLDIVRLRFVLRPEDGSGDLHHRLEEADDLFDGFAAFKYLPGKSSASHYHSEISKIRSLATFLESLLKSVWDDEDAKLLLAEAFGDLGGELQGLLLGNAARIMLSYTCQYAHPEGQLVAGDAGQHLEELERILDETPKDAPERGRRQRRGLGVTKWILRTLPNSPSLRGGYADAEGAFTERAVTLMFKFLAPEVDETQRDRLNLDLFALISRCRPFIVPADEFRRVEEEEGEEHQLLDLEERIELLARYLDGQEFKAHIMRKLQEAKF